MTSPNEIMSICKSLHTSGWVASAVFEETFALVSAGVGLTDPRWRPLLREMKSASDAMFAASVRLYEGMGGLFGAADESGNFQPALGPLYQQNCQKIAAELCTLSGRASA
jgi:hypothetical protein